MNIGGAGLGYLNFLNHDRRAQQQELERTLLRQKVDEIARMNAARPVAGKALMDAYGQPDNQLPEAPAPGEPSKPMEQGGGDAAQAPAAAAQRPQQMAPSSNYRSYDDHVAAAQPAAPEALPEPPAKTAKSAAAATDGVQRPKTMDVGSIVASLKKNNVPDWQVMDVLDQLSPIMSAANKAQIDMLRQQVNIDRVNMQHTVAEMRIGQQQRDLEFRQQKEKDDLAYKNKALSERIAVQRERVSAENTRTELQTKQLQRQIKNDDQRAAYRQVQALNAQMKNIEQEFPGLEQLAINGNQQQREAAGARLEFLRSQYDQLYKQYSEQVNSFLDLTDDHIKQSEGGGEKKGQGPRRPTAAGSAKGKPAAQNRGGRAVGDVVYMGGKPYRITGFDEDGTPLGEPAK